MGSPDQRSRRRAHLGEFDLDAESGHIINGRIPVEKGKTPSKRAAKSLSTAAATPTTKPASQSHSSQLPRPQALSAPRNRRPHGTAGRTATSNPFRNGWNSNPSAAPSATPTKALSCAKNWLTSPCAAYQRGELVPIETSRISLFMKRSSIRGTTFLYREAFPSSAAALPAVSRQAESDAMIAMSPHCGHRRQARRAAIRRPRRSLVTSEASSSSTSPRPRRRRGPHRPSCRGHRN